MTATEILPALISSLIGGVTVALINHLFTKKKTDAETRKLEAEADKIRAEAQKVGIEVQGLSATISYKLNSNAAENLLYDAKSDFDPFDFQGKGGQIWYQEQHAHKGPVGEGSLTFQEGGILNIQRPNAGGRFEVLLQRYQYGGVTKTFIPKNESISGQRRIRVSCEAKAAVKHTLEFVWKHGYDTLAHQQTRIDGNEWASVDLYFQFSAMYDCVLRIDDRDVSETPSSVQIRNLAVAEKAS